MNPSPEFEDWLNSVDLHAIAEPGDKVHECQYFLDLASNERDITRFRWLISAFFNAAYSFFEMSALHAFQAFVNPDTGEPIEDEQHLQVLRGYVRIDRNPKKPSFVKTCATHEVTKILYELRKKNTHHFPLSIMATGPGLPEAFQFGYLRGKGRPALEFCREAMALIRRVQREVEA